MNNSEQRDELAQVIAYEADKHHGFADGNLPPAQQDRELATVILAAGYRKPRTITTVGELHKLPQGAAVQTSDSADVVVLKSRSGDFRNADGGEVTSEMLWSWGAHPFTVLWEPEA